MTFLSVARWEKVARVVSLVKTIVKQFDWPEIGRLECKLNHTSIPYGA